jgi:hypothetical protein
MLPFGTTCNVPSYARRAVARKVNHSTRPITGLAVVRTSTVSPTPNWFSSRMKKPLRPSFTMLCAPNPRATPAIPALAISGARLTFR